MMSVLGGNFRADGSVQLRQAKRPAIHLSGTDAKEAKRIESALNALSDSLGQEWNLEVMLKIEKDELSGALAYSLVPFGDNIEVENTLVARSRAKMAEDEKKAGRMTIAPAKIKLARGNEKNKTRKSKTEPAQSFPSVPSFPDSPNHQQGLAHRLYNLAKPLANKYQLNLERTFGMDEAREWVEASNGIRMSLPLKNSHVEALEFYAELAAALADERSKERGLLTEPVISAEEGSSKLRVDLRGEK